MRSPARVVARTVALVRSDPSGTRAGFVALSLSTAAGLLAGLILGSMTGTLEELPGLLILVPAAVGMRGNVFGALGSRLGTSIHTGTFRVSRRSDTLVGQNIVAALVLSVSLSLVLAFIAKAVAEAFGVTDAISVGDFIVISVIGGLLPSVILVGVTVGVAEMSVRREWDPDNVEAPIVTAAGDVLTLPSLLLASFLVGVDGVTPFVLAVAGIGALVTLVYGLRTRLPMVRAIIRQSLPVIIVAGAISLVAGVVVQSQLQPFIDYPALLILIPPMLALVGSLSSILTARISSKLHLGLIEPTRFSLRPVAADVVLVFSLAAPMFAVLGVAADLIAAVTGLGSPGPIDVVVVALVAGLLATVLGVGLAFFAATTAYRLGADPDNYGIPVVTAFSDLFGAVALILVVASLGLT
ncbi:MAG: magnesium transporter [Acidimicrobiia bacterium]|nr:magnesium transporter [Acidimicrobiia bacterium]